MRDNIAGGDDNKSCAPDVIHESHPENLRELWGVKTNLTHNGITFYLYNFNEFQTQCLRNALSVLPPEYLDALPLVFRVGDPSGVLSSLNPPAPRRHMGGSHICIGRNSINEIELKRFEFISFHPAIFDEVTRYNTIFHEMGHFIDYKFHITSSQSGTTLELLRKYSTEVYRPRGNPRPAESIASGFAYFFSRAYVIRRTGEWRGTWSNPTRGDRYFPTWLYNLINDHYETNTTH